MGPTVKARALWTAPSTCHADLPPAFAIGEEPTKASEPGAKPNRAARRRAKQEGLKAGFLNGTKSKSSSGKSVEHNSGAGLSPPVAARQRACKSPVGVESIDAAMSMQVDAFDASM